MSTVLSKRRKEFVGFQKTANTTGEALCERLLTFDLDKNKVVGLGIDGAANMSGKFKSVQARSSEDVPSAQYVHCRAHSLNLVIVSSCQQASVRNMYGVVSETVTYIQSSAKRMYVFREGSEFDSKLTKFCETRWTCHEETLHSFLSNFANIVDTLLTLTGNQSAARTSTTSTSLLNSICNFQFLITIIVVEHYLKFTKPLSLTLQSPSCNLVQATQSAVELLGVFQQKRVDKTEFEKLFKNAKQLADEHDIDIKMPRLCGQQKHRLNATIDTADGVSVYTYYRLNLHLPFIDNMISELKSLATKACFYFYDTPRIRIRPLYILTRLI